MSVLEIQFIFNLTTLWVVGIAMKSKKAKKQRVTETTANWDPIIARFEERKLRS